MQNASENKIAAVQWAQAEFASASLSDVRLVKRLKLIAANFACQPKASIPKGCEGKWGPTKATYRFFDNMEVSAAAIMESHVEATRQRLRGQPVVLVVQDTTSLNFEGRAGTKGLGSIGTKLEGAQGMFAHSSLALTPERLPLGLVQAQVWCRKAEDFGRSHQRRGQPIEEKESCRWLKSYQATVELAGAQPLTRWVNISDREADFYELFELAARTPEVGVLVRARHNRKLEDTTERMEEVLARQEPAGLVDLMVPRKSGAPAHRRLLTPR